VRGSTLPVDPPSGPTTPVQTSMFDEQLPASLPAITLPAGATMQLSFFETSAAVTENDAYRAIVDESGLDQLIAALNAASAFAFDTESSGLRPFADELVGISLATVAGSAFYVPVAHHDGPQLPAARVITALKPFFEDPARPKYAHNAKFDIELLLGVGIAVRGLAFDTMIAAALLGRSSLGLKQLAFYEQVGLSEPPTAIEELIGRGSKQISFGAVPIAQATPYAAADADYTLRLVARFEAALQQQPKLYDLFTRLEMPLIAVLVDMERNGIGLDREYTVELGRRLAERIAEVEARIYGYIDNEPFNINSTDQLAEVLFHRLGISDEGVGRTAKTKKYSLTADTIEQLRDRHPIFEDILRYRQLSKLKSTYVDALPELLNPRTQRIHTSYNQVGAATGRLSSTDPNLQNIPVRTAEGREIRRGFVAAPGCRFVAADYSQIELRVLAHYMAKYHDDESLAQAFQEGQDIHAATASQLFGVAIDAVDKYQRRDAKTTVFGIIYGISAFGLSQRLGVERGYAQGLIDGIFERFPGIRAYIDATLAYGREHGFVSTLLGRRRNVPDLQNKGPRRAAAEREAINAPIQGTAADIMKIAMINVHRALQEHNLATRLLLQVHDELILEAPETEVATVVDLVRQVMIEAFPLPISDEQGHTRQSVPLAVDVEVGQNWEEMQAV
jgi:DNA polymerase-1